MNVSPRNWRFTSDGHKHAVSTREITDDSNPSPAPSADPETQADYEAGCRCAAEGDYSTAVKIWVAAADRGHAGAMRKAAFAFLAGKGTEKNDDLAAEFLQQASALVCYDTVKNIIVFVHASKFYLIPDFPSFNRYFGH